MSKTFEIVRAIIAIVLSSIVLSFIPISHGDIAIALFVSGGVFLFSVVIAFFVLYLFKKQ